VLLPSVLIGGAAVVHWSVAAAFVGILLGLAVLLVPGSLRLWRSGTRPSRTPTGRVALAAGGGALAGAAGILLTPALPEFPRGWEESVDEKLRRDVPRFIVGAPFAALGAAGVASRDRNRRRAILLGILWALPAAGSVILLTVYDVPAHRILYGSRGVPRLAGAGITMLGRWLARVPPPPLGRVLAAAIVVALVAGGVLLGRGGWRELPPERIDQTTQAAALGRYLATVGTDRPVVVAVGLRTGQAPINLIRDGLHPRDIRRLHLYLGDVETLLAGRPTLEPGNAAFNEQSLAYWRAFRPVLDDRPIIASLEALDGPGGPAPGSTVAPGVRIAAGPPLPQHLSDVRLPPGPSIPRLSVILAGALVLFGAVGIGWTILLGPPGWTSRVALAPAVGLAALVLIGVLAGRLGVDHPPARPWIAAVTAAAGWGAAFLRRSRLRTQVESPGERAEVQA
jgi:hypothetical protein